MSVPLILTLLAGGATFIGALLGAGTVWVVAKAGPALFRAVGSLCRTLFGKVR